MRDGSFRAAPALVHCAWCRATAAAQTRTPIRWPLLIVLASLAAVAPVATDLYLPGFPAMGDALGARPRAASSSR